MTSIEIMHNKHAYTVEYEVIRVKSVCEFCKQEKSDVEKLSISYIVRQQGLTDGKDVDVNSDLGEEIIECVKQEIIGEAACFDCQVEINS